MIPVSLSLLCLLLFLFCENSFGLQPQLPSKRTNKFALVTGATGRTGRMVCRLLVDRGFGLLILVRDVEKARKIMAQSLPEQDLVEYCRGELGKPQAVQAAFAKHSITHVVFTAGGDDADYYEVNYRGVADCAQQAAKNGVRHMVVISTAWTTRPYSIASLLFNSLFYDTIPMACHYMGEQELRRAAGDLNYVILRPGALVNDDQYERYLQKRNLIPTPKPTTRGLTYQQGDNFQFLYSAGRPGMSRTQLAHAVAAAVDVEGHFTVEITGSGTVDIDDTTVYAIDGQMVQDNFDQMTRTINNDTIMSIHKQAIHETRNTAVAVSMVGIGLVASLGWFQGMAWLLVVEALVVTVWREYYANRQI